MPNGNTFPIYLQGTFFMCELNENSESKCNIMYIFGNIELLSIHAI